MPTETETEAHRASDAPPPRLAARGAATADEKQQEWLRRSLKKLYEDTAQDPIPDSFVALLEELDRKEREGK